MFYHLSIHIMDFPWFSHPVVLMAPLCQSAKWFSAVRNASDSMGHWRISFFGIANIPGSFFPNNTKILALHIFRYQESDVVITWHSIDFRIFTEYLQWLQWRPTFTIQPYRCEAQPSAGQKLRFLSWCHLAIQRQKGWRCLTHRISMNFLLVWRVWRSNTSFCGGIWWNFMEQLP